MCLSGRPTLSYEQIPASQLYLSMSVSIPALRPHFHDSSDLWYLTSLQDLKLPPYSIGLCLCTDAPATDS